MINNLNSLIIDNYKINYLSGPISINILKSKIKDFNNILILFGDEHTDITNDNICNKDNKKANIINVYDEIFLNILDEYSLKLKEKYNMSIAIYLEQYSYINLKTINNDIQNRNKILSNMKYLLSFIEYNNESCFTRLNKENCKYKNIEWHYADSRTINIELISDLNSNIHKILNNIENIAKNNKIDNIENLINLLINKNKIDDINISDNEELYITYINFLINLIIKKKKLDEFLDLYYSTISENNKINKVTEDLINKQTKKNLFSDNILNIKKYYENILNNYEIKQYDSLRNLLLFIELDKILIFYKLIFGNKNLNNGLTNDDILHMIKISKLFNTFLITINSIYLDVYFINRIYKYNHNIINICYFGDYHCDNIKKYLLQNGDYELIYNYKSNYINNYDELKCIKFKDYINLDDIIFNITKNKNDKKMNNYYMTFNNIKINNLKNVNNLLIFKSLNNLFFLYSINIFEENNCNNNYYTYFIDKNFEFMIKQNDINDIIKFINYDNINNDNDCNLVLKYLKSLENDINNIYFINIYNDTIFKNINNNILSKNNFILLNPSSYKYNNCMKINHDINLDVYYNNYIKNINFIIINNHKIKKLYNINNLLSGIYNNKIIFIINNNIDIINNEDNNLKLNKFEYDINKNFINEVINKNNYINLNIENIENFISLINNLEENILFFYLNDIESFNNITKEIIKSNYFKEQIYLKKNNNYYIPIENINIDNISKKLIENEKLIENKKLIENEKLVEKSKDIINLQKIIYNKPNKPNKFITSLRR